MIFKLSAGIWFVLTGLYALAGVSVPSVLMGLFALVAGIALIADK